MSDRTPQSAADPVRHPERSAPDSLATLADPVLTSQLSSPAIGQTPQIDSLRRTAPRPDTVLALQRQLGNRTVTRLVSPPRQSHAITHAQAVSPSIEIADLGFEPGADVETPIAGAVITRDGTQFASTPPDDKPSSSAVRRAPLAPAKPAAEEKHESATAAVTQAPPEVAQVLSSIGVPDPRRLPKQPPAQADKVAATTGTRTKPNVSANGTPPAAVDPTAKQPRTGGSAAKQPAAPSTDKGPGVPPTLAAPTPAPAPAPTVAFTPNGVIDPEMARSKIDFGTWTLDELLSGGRMVLEFFRIVPGWGAIAGLAADLTGGYQDMASVPTPKDHALMETALVARTWLNVFNNALGHLKYCTELMQDGLAGSFLFSSFIPVTATAIEAEALGKVYADLCLFFLDLGIEMGSLYNQSQTEPGSEEFKAWQGLIDGYQANLLGDVVGTVLDIVAAASAGAGNTSVIKEVTGMFPLARLLIKNFGSILLQYVQSIFNVYGGSAPGVKGEQVPAKRKPSTAPGNKETSTNSVGLPNMDGGLGENAAQATALNAAAAIIADESRQARVAWRVVDTGIGLVEEQATQRLKELDDVVKKLSGGKGLFAVIQAATLKSIVALRQRVDKMTQFEAMATQGRDAAEKVRGKSDEMIAKIDAFVIPNVEIPDVDVGDGVLADLAESVANEAKSVANAALRATVSKIGEAVETAKTEIRTPVEATRDETQEFINFINIAEKVSIQQKAMISKYIDNLQNGLAQSGGFEASLDVIIGQVTTLMGMPSFKIQDLRDEWARIPSYLDELDVVAKNMRIHAAQLAKEEDETKAPVVAAVPPPEQP